MLKKLLKNKIGMTLMEIMVGSMLFGLVAMTVTAALAPMMLAFNRANDFAEYNLVMDTVANRLTSEIAQASSIDISNSAELKVVTSIGEIRYHVNNGQLWQIFKSGPVGTTSPGIEVFPDDFYKGKQISFTVTHEPPISPETTSQNYTVTIDISSTGPSGATATRTYAARKFMP